MRSEDLVEGETVQLRTPLKKKFTLAFPGHQHYNTCWNNKAWDEPVEAWDAAPLVVVAFSILFLLLVANLRGNVNSVLCVEERKSRSDLTAVYLLVAEEGKSTGLDEIYKSFVTPFRFSSLAGTTHLSEIVRWSTRWTQRVKLQNLYCASTLIVSWLFALTVVAQAART